MRMDPRTASHRQHSALCPAACTSLWTPHGCTCVQRFRRLLRSHWPL